MDTLIGADGVFAENPAALIDQIHKRNMKAGVAISPDTPSEAIADEVGKAADMLLVMTVHPGFFSFPSLWHVVFIFYLSRPWRSEIY